MTGERSARTKAERAGRGAEILAALYLSVKGYHILARRFRAAGGEIDLVARSGDTLVLVEVKSRRDADAALEAVTPRARARIESAGRAFLARRRGFDRLALRYDVIAVGAGWVRHIRDAWRAAPPR